MRGFRQRGLRRRGTTLDGETCVHQLQSFGFGYAMRLLDLIQEFHMNSQQPRSRTAPPDASCPVLQV